MILSDGTLWVEDAFTVRNTSADLPPNTLSGVRGGALVAAQQVVARYGEDTLHKGEVLFVLTRGNRSLCNADWPQGPPPVF